MMPRTKLIASLVFSLLLVCGLATAAYVDMSEGVQYLNGDPSPAVRAPREYREEVQVNLDPDTGEVRILQVDEKILLNEYEARLIPLSQVSERELRPIARALAAKEGGWAQIVRDTKKKRYYVQVVAPPFMMPHLVETIKVLDKEWLNATDDGTGTILYQAQQRRSLAGPDFFIRRYQGGTTNFDGRQNALTYNNDPAKATNYANVIKSLDVPANEITVEGEFVEISTNNDLKLGLDYVAWKNGPGRNLFEFVLGNTDSYERYRGASSIYNVDPPNVESLADSFWDLLQGKSVSTESGARQRYASYNVFATAAYIDFLKVKGYAKVVARPYIQTISGTTATWDSMDPVVAFQVTGSNTKTLYSESSPTYLRRVAFVNDILLAIEYAGPALGISADDLDEYASLRDALNLSGDDINGLEYVAYVLAQHLRSDSALLEAVADTINGTGLLGGVTVTGGQIVHVLQVLNGSGDLGAWDRYLNYSYVGEVGAALTVTPVVGQETTEMDIDVEMRSVTGYSPQGTPLIATRAVSTTVRTMDGEKLLLAGLQRDAKVKQAAGIPFLSRIPVLGYLFGGETTQKSSNSVVVTLDTTTTTGKGSVMAKTENMDQVIADAKDDGENFGIPRNSFGFDQFWLGGDVE